MFWEEVEHTELDTTILYPGALLKTTQGCFSIRHRAPLIGENNEEIYINELNLSKEDLLILMQRGII